MGVKFFHSLESINHVLNVNVLHSVDLDHAAFVVKRRCFVPFRRPTFQLTILGSVGRIFVSDSGSNYLNIMTAHGCGVLTLKDTVGFRIPQPPYYHCERSRSRVSIFFLTRSNDMNFVTKVNLPVYSICHMYFT